mgnify:CR=1 FL=1
MQWDLTCYLIYGQHKPAVEMSDTILGNTWTGKRQFIKKSLNNYVGVTYWWFSLHESKAVATSSGCF